MKTVKKIIRCIISIILTISIICLILINIASSTILNKNYVLDQLEKTNYYSKIHEEAESNFENYIYQSGLDKEVLDNVLTEEKIKKDTNIIITNLYDGIEEEIDTQEIKDRINQNILNTVGKLTITEQKAVDTLVDKMCKEYTNTILHFNAEEQINNMYHKVMKYTKIVQKASLILIGVSAIILVVISLRRIYKIFTFTGISLISSGAFLVVVNGFINAKIKVQTITILSEAISKVLRDTISGILGTINSYGVILLITGIILVIVANLLHNIIKAKYTEENEK